MKKFYKTTAIIIFLIIVAVVFSFKKDISIKDLISTTLVTCSHESGRNRNILCLKKHLEGSVIKYGIGPFVEVVGNMFVEGDSNLTSATQCHDVLHAIGEVGGANSKDVNKTISQCSAVCTYGCFHGVIEGYLMKGADIAQEIPQLCQIEGNDNGNFKSACYHGLGHGVASVVGFDFSNALDKCDLIPEERYKIDCGSGVIMELYEPGSFNHAQLEWPADIPKFCNSLKYPYSKVCHTTAGLHEYGRSQSPQKAFRACESVPKDLSRECNISIGRNFYYVFQGSSSKIIEACKNKNETVFLSCVQGGISSSLAVDSQSQKGYEICGKLDNKFKNKCLEFLK
ncbi:MAG: hypothetical protein AAB638_01540 [Patescibacteria group bacterium]